MCKDLRKASSIEALSISQTASFFAAEFEALAIYGVNQTTQPMTATPDFIWNINATYENESWGTQLGIFYNLQGESLISAANPYTTLLKQRFISFHMARSTSLFLRNCLRGFDNSLPPKIF